MKEKELEMLRTEMQFLKNCQVRYFILSIGASGAIIGLADKFSGNTIPPFVYLAPLLVVIPCWWIFFDKATTITRIVGYLRLIELMVINKRTCGCQHVGWENALFLFRNDYDIKKIGPFLKGYIKGIFQGIGYSMTLFASQRYWALCWYTFLGLSVTSLVLAYSSPYSEHFAWQFCLWSVIISAVHNLSVAGRLVVGPFSYNSNFLAWKEKLAPEKIKNHLDKYCPKDDCG